MRVQGFLAAAGRAAATVDDYLRCRGGRETATQRSIFSSDLSAAYFREVAKLTAWKAAGSS
jgi:hypothetical protein